MANIELTASQVRELHALDQPIIDLEAVLRKAELAGLDVSELAQRLADTKARRMGLLAQFSPGLSAREKR